MTEIFFAFPAKGLENSRVIRPKFTFKEVLTEAARAYPDLWMADGRLNVAAVARHYKSKGHPVPQATLSRILNGKHQRPSEGTIEATAYVFRIPRAMVRGEPMTQPMEKLLADYKLSTLLLAQKLESLPREDFANICREIERAFDREETLKRALQHSNITHLRPG